MNRNDRNIAIAASIAAVLALVGIFIIDNSETETESPEVIKDTLSIKEKSYNYPRKTYTYAVEERKVEQFPFDPNTADSTQLLRLGLQPWQVQNIYKYRARGGVYRRKEDFARLYGLTVKDYRRLEPYIRISSDYQPSASLIKDEKPAHDSLQYPRKLEAGEHIELNTEDTTQLIKVPGIGPYYARKILRYGKQLGGYVSIDQLDEIENFPSDSKKYFVISQSQPQKLNLNRLNLQQLRRHPYINYYQAKTIIDYRRLHGPINSLQDLRLSKDFTPEVIGRLEPYVTF